jgi:hypothetical protein
VGSQDTDGLAVELADQSPEASPTPASSPWWSSIAALRIVSLVMAGLTLVWSTIAILTATRGFDPTDEGGYLLSYRWWSENLHSGSQYLYPSFEVSVRHRRVANLPPRDDSGGHSGLRLVLHALATSASIGSAPIAGLGTRGNVDHCLLRRDGL